MYSERRAYLFTTIHETELIVKRGYYTKKTERGDEATDDLMKTIIEASEWGVIKITRKKLLQIQK